MIPPLPPPPPPPPDVAPANARAVFDSAELRRIADMPRRDWREVAERWGDAITRAFRTPTGRQTLRPIQAAALAEIGIHGGLFGPIGVGHGKTLITFLAPRVARASRPLLLIPAALRNKTDREFADLRAHWKGPEYIRILHYEALSRVDSAGILEAYAPDLIIADECHRLKNPASAVSRRVARYMGKAPDTKFVALSGTITNRSILEYHHLAFWALKDRTFIPRDYRQIETWAAALDEIKPGPGAWGAEAARVSPKALIDRLAPGRPVTLDVAREAFRERMTTTPGVVASSGEDVSASLTIRFHLPQPQDPAITSALAEMAATWETPDGHPFSEAFQLWRHARELACGFFYRWNPRPPAEWLEARRAWASWARSTLSANRRGIDSELQLAQAVDAGLYPHDGAPLLAAWRAVRDTFTPNSEPVWISDQPLQWAAAWAKKNPGIIWVEHEAVGARLEQLTGIPFYGRQGLHLGTGQDIQNHPADRPLIASIAANSEGRNLQKWSRNLVTSPPPTGKTWEQMIGRTHRSGQTADTVEVDVMIGSPQSGFGVHQAIRDAEFTSKTTGHIQRLTYADLIDLPTPEFLEGWI